MNHKVNSVADLHSDATALYNNVVVGGADTSADSIIANIASGIEILKSCWEGKDAGTQIQNLVIVHNAMVEIRNALGHLASSASKIAANYRDIQNSNGAGLESLSSLTIDEKTKLGDYTDDRDTINITEEAKNGKAKVDAANNSMPGFINEVKNYYSKIINNWTAGTGREEAQQAFDGFISNSQVYQQKLTDVSTSITNALQNYTF